ncbi:MAG: asparaginase [Rhodospirillaceae bacterium]|nr:asparaginase [Rhodospirillaceae bacterium]MBT4426918.1 asparaginase [Rhodospirillaceae bacterium]
MSATHHGCLVIECSRGSAVESSHLVDAALVDASGQVVEAWGDIERFVYPRSAVKSIQVLPFFESGAADKTGATESEIALACASHNGQAAHVSAVRSWLARTGLDETHLECGGHLPYHSESAHECIRRGEAGAAIHNMCSGKHSAFLVTAKMLGEETQDYIQREHPVQRRVSAAIQEMTGWDLSRSPWAIDGCSIPTIGLPLHALARGAANIADPSAQPAERQAAIARIRAAIAAEPFMIAGDARACSDIIPALDGKAYIKFGAEGVFFAPIQERGLGLALKVRDGATRAADTAIASLLAYLGLLDSAAEEKLAGYLEMPLSNWRGINVGTVRAVLDK